MTNESSIYPTITLDTINAIANGRHGQPFEVLGPHPHDKGLIIRAFLPQTAVTPNVTVEVVEKKGKKQAWPMVRVLDVGFYELLVPRRKKVFPYHFRVTWSDGNTTLVDDPYAFPSTLSDYDHHLMVEGTHQQIYEKLGAHLMEHEGVMGTRFAVWAPNALRVSIIGDFNRWDGRRHPMRFHPDSGIWELFIPGISQGTRYKYELYTAYDNYMVAKADPVGFASELRPQTASVVWDINQYEWQDNGWMTSRNQKHTPNNPIAIYEVHLGSWRRNGPGEDDWLSYEELAQTLIPYVKEMGYTHIELLPIMEHPYDGSWGYQVTGYFAPTRRFGTPEEFMGFVDACHQAGLGVILDWVPAHFPTDQHGLGFFDGTHLYEHADPRQGFHPDWGTMVYNYGRHEVSQFLISNALFWLDKYHIDGLRVDAVASMIFLNFSREEGDWIPNIYGGSENLEAIAFLKRLNEQIHEQHPGTITFAEESSAWPGVTQPPPKGLGFDFKWNMGWMNDTLRYMQNDPVYRSFHQGALTFSLMYAFNEKFMLPFSHDEVVHLKKSMLDKMPGDTWQKFANLRLLYAYMYSHPGKKLLFMGNEFGQWHEWTEKHSLDWHLLEEDQDERHKQLQTYVKRLNHLYQAEAALYIEDTSWDGFTWLDFRDGARSILAYARHDKEKEEILLVVCNFTPVVRYNYRLGTPIPGLYKEILSSDASQFGGSGIINEGEFKTEAILCHEQDYSMVVTLPPLGTIYLKLIEAEEIPKEEDEDTTETIDSEETTAEAETAAVDEKVDDQNSEEE